MYENAIKLIKMGMGKLCMKNGFQYIPIKKKRFYNL